MKIGFNEGCNRFCKDHSVMKDLEYCDKYGFDYIDIQSECLDRDLDEGKYTIEDLAEAFKNHNVKMLSYNALVGFNMKDTEEEKRDVMDELDLIIERCNILDCDLVVVVPSVDVRKATRQEIKEDAIEVLSDMLEKVEPHGIKLSLEFCGAPNMSINRFDDALEIVKAIDNPNLGITLDQYHFHAMASFWETLEESDGKHIFIWHINGTEDMPCGAPYNTDEVRLWPGAKGDCLDHQRYADTLKKIGFNGGVCTIEVFRPEYYELSQEENVKTAAEVTKAHVEQYW